MMKKLLILFVGLLTLCPSLLWAQIPICNPTENWLPTQYPGEGPKGMTEMNGNLYVIDFHTSSQQYHLYKYDGWTWELMSTLPVDGGITDIIAYQDQIIVSGYFDGADIGVPDANRLVRWDSLSNSWSNLGTGALTPQIFFVYQLIVFDGDLYIGGQFNEIGGIPAKSMARWDGSSWDSVGPQNLLQPFSTQSNMIVQYLTIWNNQLVMGGLGHFNGTEYMGIWDGSSWAPVAASPNTRGILASYNGELLIQNTFSDSIGNQPIPVMGRFDGSSWSGIGMGPSDFFDMKAMTTYQGDLWVTGAAGFGVGYMIAGLPYQGIARWDGSNWHTVTGFLGNALDIIVYQDRLFICGGIYESCGIPMDNVLTLCTLQECTKISGKVYQDDNMDCLPGMNEPGMNQQFVEIQPDGFQIPTDSSGAYSFLLDSGIYNVDLVGIPSYYTNYCPGAGYTVNLTSGQGMTNLDFGLEPIPFTRDLAIDATNNGAFRPGFTGRITLTASNFGTQSESGFIELEYDPQLIFTNNTSIPLTSQTGNTLSWNYSNLGISQNQTIWADFDIPVTAQLGDTLCFVARIEHMVNDSNPVNNIDTLKFVITGSYDPNDKSVVPMGIGEIGEIYENTAFLTYTIRFQNTGTDTAFTVILRDAIDPALDLGSLSVIGASHNWHMYLEEDRLMRWTFPQILLPDSNTNEPASHGFLKYQIHLKEDLPLGTQIENAADIYFDFNLPIRTNTTINTLVHDPLDIEEEIQPGLIRVWPQPVSGHLKIENQHAFSDARVQIFDLKGQMVLQKNGLNGHLVKMDLNGLPPGIYVLQIRDQRLGIQKIKISIL